MSDHLIAEANQHARALIIERDQLRAELARLDAEKPRLKDANYTCALLIAQRDNLLKPMRDEAIARAERAEVELANIRALADRRNERDHSQDTTHQLVAALDQALDIAQAELAQFRELDAERARMRQIAVDKRIRTPTPRTDEEAGSLIDAEEVVPADFARELERELATERARLDWLEENANDIMKYNCRSYIWFAHQNIRAAIDAAMKEETK